MTLLIVPYGIETTMRAGIEQIYSLLIVPYGIETVQTFAAKTCQRALLIVPYGIETNNQ